MSEETFWIVVAVAVLIACLAFVVQAGVMIALFRLTRKMQAKTAGFMEKAEPVLAKMEPVFDKIGPVIEKIGPALDSINAAAAKVGPAIDRFRPVVDRAVVVVERTGVLIQSVNRVTATANLMMQDVRPRIADISNQTVAIVRSGREQVERVGDLLHDAGDRTHARLEQIDHAVEAPPSNRSKTSPAPGKRRPAPRPRSQRHCRRNLCHGCHLGAWPATKAVWTPPPRTRKCSY